MIVEIGAMNPSRKRKPPLYLMAWPASVGGSETKTGATAELLAGLYDIVWVPNDDASLSDRKALKWITSRGMRAARWADLPRKLAGTALAMCNIPFLTEGRAAEAKGRGLRVAWGGEMMWAIPGELGAIAAGLVDTVLFTGDGQREALTPAFLTALGGKSGRAERVVAAHPAHGGTQGTLRGKCGAVRWATVGNYVNPDAFPFLDRSRRRKDAPLVIGRLSRADWGKFPADFPKTYERLGLPKDTRFRVMAWSPELKKRWPRWRPSKQWELLPAMAEPPAKFLQSLDLFVYDTHPTFSESWGRAVVEAMLTGAVPVLPADTRHHFVRLAPHILTSAQCPAPQHWREQVQCLAERRELRHAVSKLAATFAHEELCDAAMHRASWQAALGAR